MIRKLLLLVLSLGLLAAAFVAGWTARGLEPVGGMPTTAALNQIAVSESEADQTATLPPTVGAPTSTAAPTVAQPTSTPTVTATPERAVWDIECPVKLVGALVECMELVTRGSEEPGVARLYWVGKCLPYGTLITLWKQGDDEGWRELYQGPEWSWYFDPNECSRETESPSPNHIVLQTQAGPGTYRISVRAGGDSLLLKSFYWNAPAASVPTSTPTGEPIEPTAAPSVATVEETPAATFTMEPRVQSSTPLRGFAASPTEVLHDTPGDGARWIGTVWYRSPVYIWECGVALSYPEGTYLSLVSHEGDDGVKVGWIATASYTERHPCSFYAAPGVGALINYLVAAGYGDEQEIRELPGLQYDPYSGVNQDLD